MSLYKTGSFFGIFLVNFHENSREPCGRMSLGQDGYWSKWRAAACKSQVAPRSPEWGGGWSSDSSNLQSLFSGLITGLGQLPTTANSHANIATWPARGEFMN